MRNEMGKEQDEAHIGRLSYPRQANAQRNRMFRPRFPANSYNTRPAVKPQIFMYDF